MSILDIDLIKKFILEEKNPSYDIFLKKQERFIFRIKELEVEGINSEKFENTRYIIPDSQIIVIIDKNFTGKTTFIELCALAIHGRKKSTELPLDVKKKVKKTKIVLNFNGKDLIIY